MGANFNFVCLFDNSNVHLLYLKGPLEDRKIVPVMCLDSGIGGGDMICTVGRHGQE
jgi:hypothetical protein